MIRDGGITLPNGAIVPEDLPRVPSPWAFRLDARGRRSSLGHLSCVPVVVPVVSTFTFIFVLADLFLIIVVAVLVALAWFRPTVGIVAFVGRGMVAAIVLSRLLPVLGLRRPRRFIARDGGFVNGVYVAPILRTESWHRERRYAE